MRELRTIGLLDRSTSRYTRRMRGMAGTLASFSVPADGSAAGDALQNAAIVLLNFLDQGVPSMHQASAEVLAFQQAYNADPITAATSKLSLDSAYGPNTQAALNVLVGGVAPAPNDAPPAPGGVTVLPTIVVPGTVAPSKPASSGGDTGMLLLLAGGGLLAAWLLLRKKKTRHHAVSNPLRRRTGRRGARRAA
jgi:hypothetical protein